MLKEFIQHIQETTINKVVRDNDNKTAYIVGNDGTYTQIKPEIEAPECICLHSLEALVKMVKYEVQPVSHKLFINIPSVEHVDSFFSPDPEPEQRFFRLAPYTVRAIDVPGFRDGFRDHDKAIIELQTMFEQNEGTAYLLDLLSKISTDSNVITTDNGVSQKVEVMTGVNLKSRTPVKPRVKLRPFRTFQEVEQPESEFLLRLDDQGRVGLFEADGYMWRLQARQTIKAFLEEQLAEEVEAGTVVIAL